MKHLLILISILLLSFPVIGDNNKGETLYAWGEYIPFVWKGFGDKETHPKYTGDVKNGKPDGQGTETFPDGSKYIGEFKDGSLNGQGTYTFSGGGKFVGEFKDDNRWNGIRYDKNGNIIYKVVNGKWNRTITPP